MLNKPKFMSPSTNLQECVVDISSDKLLYSCMVDGNEAVYGWRIKIYSLSDNILVYDTGKIVSLNDGGAYQPLFFPVNEKNQNVIFEVDLKKYSSVSVDYTDSNGETISPLFQNSTTPYYWIISLWNKTDVEGNNIATATSYEEVFFANTSPAVSFKYKNLGQSDYSDFVYGTTLTANKYIFKANYEQKENIPLKRYGWRITDTESETILLDTISQNQIYGTADNIVCSYNGFLNNGRYSIELFVETQNGYTYLTEAISFTVEYTTSFLTNDFVTEILPKEASILNSWGDAKAIEGNSSSNHSSYISSYPIVEEEVTAIHILPNEKIVYDYNSSTNIDISEDSYIVLSTQLPNNTDTLLFLAEGVDKNEREIIRKLTFEDGKFKYSINDPDGDIAIEYYTPADGYSPSKYVWYVITMYPYATSESLLRVVEFRAENGLYPSEDLFPNDNLKPSFGTWVSRYEKEV